MTWVARIAIDRPERMNAFDIDTHEEFLAAIDRVENDDDIQVAVITGTGQRAFCSGRDLKWTAQVRRASDKARADVDRRMAALMRLQFRDDITKPLLARANGVAAADHVEMGLPEARRAFIAGAMGIHSLPRQIPHHLAMGFLLTGRHFSAPKAAELGLVNQVTPMEELDSAVDSWIAGIIRCSPAAIRATKESALDALHLSLADAGQYRGPMESAWLTSSDRIEGPRAFADKRNLDWS